MVPIRIISENLGYEVTWDKVNRVAKIKDSKTNVELKVGDSTALVNGVRKPIDRRESGEVVDTKSYIKDSRTYVPLRFVAEAFGADIEYARINAVHHIEIDNTGKGLDPIPVPEPIKPEKGTPIKENASNPFLKGNGDYTIYPESNKVIFDGPLLTGDFETELIGNEPEGWVEPKFAVLHNLDVAGRRSNIMFEINIINTSQLNGEPVTTARSTPEIEKLAVYKVKNDDGTYTHHHNKFHINNRAKLSNVYSLNLSTFGRYEDGSKVKHLPLGTEVPVTIDYTYKGYTKTYEIPVKINMDN